MINLKFSIDEIAKKLSCLPYSDIIEMTQLLKGYINNPIFTDILKESINENTPNNTWNSIKAIILPKNCEVVSIYTIENFRYSAYYYKGFFYTIDTVKLISIPLKKVSHWSPEIFNKTELLEKFYSLDNNLNIGNIKQIVNQFIYYKTLAEKENVL